MKKQLFLFTALLVIGIGFSAYAQPTNLKTETKNSKSSSTVDKKITALKRPVNIKGKPVAVTASRGDVYGPDYSDVVINNYTGYYIDIYINGNFRVTVPPGQYRTSWAIPGVNVLVGKAPFSDGSYISWGPWTTYTGYQYTWNLYP